MTIDEAKKAVELAEYDAKRARDEVEESEERAAVAEKALDAARKTYERIVGAAPSTAEAAAIEAEYQRDRAQARRLYEDAGRPVPSWLK